MHAALGMTYAYLGTWTSTTSEYQNAIFQLSHAMTAAARAPRPPPPQDISPALPPPAVEKLAEGYLATGREDLAARARVYGAAALNRVGHVGDSEKVFRTISAADVASPDQGSRAKYEELRMKLPKP